MTNEKVIKKNSINKYLFSFVLSVLEGITLYKVKSDNNVFGACGISRCSVHTNNSTTRRKKVKGYIGVTLPCLTGINLK